MRAVRRVTLRVLGVVFALTMTRASAAHGQARDTLVLGTYAYARNDRVVAVTPLALHLAVRLARPVRVRSFADPVALARATRAGEVDVIVTNTFGYLLMAGDGRAPSAVPVATFRIPAGVRTNYGTVVVARDSALRAARDLLARASSVRLALVSAGSTTGNLVPRLWLASVGIADAEGAMRAVTYAGTHALAYEALRTGAADVAALATEEYDARAAADTTRASRAWRELWRSPDILLGPVAVRASMAPALRAAIAAAVVGVESSAPLAFAALKGGWVEARLADAMVAATDATYDPLRRLFGDPRTTAALIERFAK